MQQAHVQHEIRELAWEGTAIELINNQTCGNECVSLCFSDFNNRFENIEMVDQSCLIAHCDCDSGHTHYSVENNIES